MTSQSNSKVKVLHILGSASFGGIEKLTADLVDVQLNDPAFQPGVLFAMTAEGGMSGEFPGDVIDIFSLGLLNGYDVNPAKRRKAIEIMRDYDILHIHSYNPLIASAAINSQRPIFYTEHGNFGFGRAKTVADYIKKKMLKRFLNRHVNFISFNSKFTQVEADARYALKSVSKQVIYNGVKLNTGTRTENIPTSLSEKLEGKFVVGTSTRFAGFKRIDRLISGFSYLRKMRDDVVLILVGDGELRPEFERQVETLGISDSTIFTGYQSNVTMYQSLMDVCVFPSCNEPFGLVAIEAYALGKPVLVFSDGGGFIETVGMFAANDVVDDIPALTQRLDEYYLAGKSRPDQEAARIAYAKTFDIKNMASKLSVAYRKVLSCAE